MAHSCAVALAAAAAADAATARLLPGHHAGSLDGMDEEQPVDPFLGDPEDPVAELAALDDEPEDEPAPLTVEEREEVVGDLADLDGFRTLLEPKGVRGLVVDCASCDEAHYFNWELLRGNLLHLLEHGETRVHEPAFGPDPEDYVSWEYARGYADAVLDADED